MRFNRFFLIEKYSIRVLTRDVEARLPADNGAEGVRRQALIDSHILVFIQAVDVQVSAVEREARPGPSLDEGVVELPPAGIGKQPKSRSGKNTRESFPSINQARRHKFWLIICLCHIKNVIQVRSNLQQPHLKRKVSFSCGFLSLQIKRSVFSQHFPFLFCRFIHQTAAAT